MPPYLLDKTRVSRLCADNIAYVNIWLLQMKVMSGDVFIFPRTGAVELLNMIKSNPIFSSE